MLLAGAFIALMVQSSVNFSLAQREADGRYCLQVLYSPRLDLYVAFSSPRPPTLLTMPYSERPQQISRCLYSIFHVQHFRLRSPVHRLLLDVSHLVGPEDAHFDCGAPASSPTQPVPSAHRITAPLGDRSVTDVRGHRGRLDRLHAHVVPHPQAPRHPRVCQPLGTSCPL